MTKLFSAVALAAAMFSTQAFAQSAPMSDTSRGDDMPVMKRPPLPQNTITTAPTNLLGGVYSVEYERALTNNLSVFVSPSVVSFFNVTTGFRLNGGVRFFVSGEAPSGFFVSPQVFFDTGSSLSYSYDSAGTTAIGTQAYTTWSVGAGLMVGYTLLLGNVFDISLGFGGAGQYTNVVLGASTGAGAAAPVAGLNALILPRVNIGFAF